MEAWEPPGGCLLESPAQSRAVVPKSLRKPHGGGATSQGTGNCSSAVWPC